jgi:hypothetical protein
MNAAVSRVVFQLSFGKSCPVDREVNKIGLLQDIISSISQQSYGRNMRITNEN